jgi:hypothetical protein
MSFSQIFFSSKLRILTFVVFPIFIILIVCAWAYMLFFNNSVSPSVDQNQNSLVEISSAMEQTTSKKDSITYSKGVGTKVSFDDLEKPKSASVLKSSIIAATSPIPSTPELDAVEISTLLETIETLGNDDDISLDNQILEN